MSLKAILYCDFEVKKRDKKSTGKSSLFISQILKINFTLVKNRGAQNQGLSLARAKNLHTSENSVCASLEFWQVFIFTIRVKFTLLPKLGENSIYNQGLSLFLSNIISCTSVFFKLK